MRRLGAMLVLATTLGVALLGGGALAGMPCAGRYVVRDAIPPLIDGGAAVDLDAVVLTPSGAAIESGCSLAPTTARPRRKGGWKVRARWARCGSLARVRLRATVGADCRRLEGRVTARKGRVRRRFSATPSTCGDGLVDPGAGEACEPPGSGSCDLRCQHVPPGCGNGRIDPGEECDDGNTVDGDGCTSSCRRQTTCEGQETFEVIQDRIFNPTCAVAGCHGALGQANLDLRPEASHVSLVDVLVDNPTARAAGTKRVLPGDPSRSFLSRKLHGMLLAGEGERMPLLGLPLSPLELEVIDAWIAAGAPAVGAAPGVPCLPTEGYEPAAPLPVPPGGFQVVLEGPVLPPGGEEEGCLWVPVPNASDFAVSKFEFSLNPGSHHFAIVEYQNAGAPQTGVWQRNNVGCFNGAQFGGIIAGAPQAPYYVNPNPPGVARILHAGKYLGLNAHYHNAFDVPIQIKVWTNIYPYAGTPAHIAETLMDLGSTFSISVAPFTQEIHRGRYTNSTGQPLYFTGLSGHMHFRGLRFTAWESDATKVYESFDWGHPGSRGFDPPFVLAPGDYFDYECLYDNGVTRPVRRDGAGNPTNLVFGLSVEDAMCILGGGYYRD